MTALLHESCLGSKRHSQDVAVAVASSSGADQLSYQELFEIAGSLARDLDRHGVRPGNRLALDLPNGIAFVCALFGGLITGASVAALDPSLKASGLEQHMATLAPAAVITSVSRARRFRGIPAEAQVFVLERRGAQRFELVPLVPDQSRRAHERSPHALQAVEPPPTTPESDCLLIATSGSTSGPKFVRLSHRAALANAKMHIQSLRLSAPPRSLQILPVNYSYGLVASLIGTLSSEGTVVFAEQIDIPSICSAVALRADLCHSTPPFLRFLFENASSEQLDLIRRLRRITIGGDACPLPLRRRIAETLPDSLAYITYGLTEAGPRVATLAPDLFLEQGDSVGLALQGVELRVMRDGVPCAAGTAGNLEIRSPSLMSGYLGDVGGPNAEMVVDGWLRTSEIASVDAHGFLRILGRGDRQVKFRGRRLNPATVEACLTRHPSIVAARVRPGRVGDVERLTAQVYYRAAAEDVARLESELRLQCRRELPAYLVPDEIDLQPSPDYFLKDSFLTIRQDGANNAS